MLYQPIKFGHLTARIMGMKWYAPSQIARIQYGDDLGVHICEADGASVSECRRAVADHMMHRVADAQEG